MCKVAILGKVEIKREDLGGPTVVKYQKKNCCFPLFLPPWQVVLPRPLLLWGGYVPGSRPLAYIPPAKFKPDVREIHQQWSFYFFLGLQCSSFTYAYSWLPHLSQGSTQ